MPEFPTKTILFHGMSIVDPLTLLLLSRLSQLEAVVVATDGESNPQAGLELTMRYLKAFGATDTKVGLGTERTTPAPFSFPQTALGIAMGAMRIGTGLESVPNVELTSPGVELVKECLEKASPHSVDLVCSAPATDLANLITSYPELADKINKITLMTGAVDVPGNVHDFGHVKGLEENPPECNAAADPDALARVLSSGVRVQQVPLDATGVLLSQDLLELLRNAPDPVGQMLFGYFQRMYRLSNLARREIPVWDPLTAAASLDPASAKFEQKHISVDAVGRTAEDPAGSEVEVCQSIDAVRFMNLLRQALGYNSES